MDNSSGKVDVNIVKRPGRPQKYNDEMIRATLYIPKSVYDAVKVLATRQGKSFNETVVLILSSYDKELLRRLFERWNKALEMLREISESVKQEVSKLEALRAEIHPSNILQKIEMDQKTEELIQGFLKEMNWVEELAKEPNDVEAYRRIQQEVVDSFVVYCIKNGYKIESREGLDVFLANKILPLVSQKRKEIRASKPAQPTKSLVLEELLRQIKENEEARKIIREIRDPKQMFDAVDKLRSLGIKIGVIQLKKILEYGVV